MRDLRFAQAWRLGGFLLLAAAFVSLLAPGGADVLPPGDYDKLAHAVGFFGLTLWFAGVYRRSMWLRVAAGMLAFGLVTELAQGLATRSRSADPLDLAADALGVAAGLLAARGGLDGWARMIERVLVRA